MRQVVDMAYGGLGKKCHPRSVTSVKLELLVPYGSVAEGGYKL